MRIVRKLFHLPTKTKEEEQLTNRTKKAFLFSWWFVQEFYSMAGHLTWAWSTSKYPGKGVPSREKAKTNQRKSAFRLLANITSRSIWKQDIEFLWAVYMKFWSIIVASKGTTFAFFHSIFTRFSHFSCWLQSAPPSKIQDPRMRVQQL